MKILFVIVLFLIFTGCIMFDQNDNYPLSKGEELVNTTLVKTARIIKNKYKLQPSGSGAAMPGGPIQELTLCFDTCNQLTKEKLRKLLMNSAQELLNQINENKDIQEFLIKRPFTIKDVEIIIYNHDKNGEGVRDPEISTARISQGILIYRTIDPKDNFKFKNEFEETYEEALKFL